MSNEVSLGRLQGSQLSRFREASERFFEEFFAAMLRKRAQEAGYAVEAIPYAFKGAKGDVYTTRVRINDRVCSLHRLERVVYRDDVYRLPYWQAQLVYRILEQVDGVVFCTKAPSVVVCTSEFLREKVFGPNPTTCRRNVYWPHGHAVWADSIGRDLLQCEGAFHVLDPQKQLPLAA